MLDTLEQRHDSLQSTVTTTRTELKRVLNLFGARLQKYRLGRRLLISESFASAATQCTGQLVSVGKFRLRGLAREQEIFSLDIPEAMA